MKTAIITGATSGIGRETAKMLAGKDLLLVLPVRNIPKGEVLKKEILENTPQARIDLMECDLASFDSIRKFADHFNQKYDHLHLLVNNAGLWNTKRELTKDDIEMTFAVNHLAMFLLTNLLLDKIRESAPARIVNVSSEVHRQGKINFNDLEYKKKYSGLGAYAQSKLANILFTKKLSAELKNTDVTVNCLHPGGVNTNFFDDLPWLIRLLVKPFLISAKKGAETPVYLSVSDEVNDISGAYFAKKKKKEPSALALRQDVADQLWEVSKQYTETKK